MRARDRQGRRGFFVHASRSASLTGGLSNRTVVSKVTRMNGARAAAIRQIGRTNLNEIETASAAITVQGARYPEAMERLIDR